MPKVVIDDAPRPGTPEHRKLITASKVPAILGLSPWQSQYALWHEMAGNIPPEEVTPRRQAMFDWGHSAELAIADWDLKQNPGCKISDGEVAYTDTDLPFPHLVTLDRVMWQEDSPDNKSVREYKTANSIEALNKWGPPHQVDAVPAHYLAQHIFQRGVSGIHHGAIILQAMGTPDVYKVEWDEGLYQGILERLAAWWESLESGTPPPLDGSTATYKTLRGLHPDIEQGAICKLTKDEAIALLAAKTSHAKADEDFKRLRNDLALKMGHAQYAQVGDTIVARRQKGRGGVNLVILDKAGEQLNVQ